jgi:DNA-directed RNA polymerase subunit beta'
MGHINCRLPYLNPIASDLVGGIFGVSGKALLDVAVGTSRYYIEEAAGSGPLISSSGVRYRIQIVGKEDPEWENSDYSIYSLLSDLIDLDISGEETLSKHKNPDVRRYYENGFTSVLNFFNTSVLVPPPLHRDISISNGEISYHPTNILYLRLIRVAHRFQVIMESENEDMLVLLREEARVLQHLVNSVYTEGAKDHRGNAIPAIMDKLGGKEGLFRGNMLGKRIDYSGRSSITTGPDLPIDTCAVPFKMMYTLLEPHILGRLVTLAEERFNGEANPYTVASRWYKRQTTEAVEACYDLAKEAIVILNRAPSLHRYSVMGFKVVLHSGKSIRIPPLICSPFNADHDGDTMAIHLPLSKQALAEFPLYSVQHNLMSSIDYDTPNMSPSHEAVVGLYQLTL